MIIEKYGIRLKRLTIHDIELVRKKRNSPEIASTMEYQKHITTEEQKKWFLSINNINNFFFLIEYKNETIGLLNDKNIDWENRISEAGLFIWDKQYHNTIIPGLSSLILLELGYELLHWKKTMVKVLNANHNVISYIKTLGFIADPESPPGKSGYFYIDKKKYHTQTRKVILSMTKLSEDREIKIRMNSEDSFTDTKFLLNKIELHSGIKLKAFTKNHEQSYSYQISE